MKKYVRVLAVMALLPQLSYGRVILAQPAEGDVDRELDQMYRSSQGVPQSGQGGVVSSAAAGAQPIYIVNQATPTSNNTQLQSAQQIQKQPITLIQEAPLEETRADQFRRARQGAEMQTEMRIVEKLERARLEDEQKRQQSLFNDNQLNGNSSINSVSQMQGPSQNISVVQTPQVVAPVPVVPVQTPVQVVPEHRPVAVGVERDEVREEIREELVEEHRSHIEGIRYFSTLLGVGEYPDAQNVQGNYYLGAAFGTRLPDYAIEGLFSYANFGLNQTYIDPYYGYSAVVFPLDVNQYSAGLSLKYFFMKGVVRPIAGGIIQYSYRTYTNQARYNSYNYNGGGYPGYPGANNNMSNSSTHAVDVGFVTGVDFDISPTLALGLDFRYMFNMYNRANVNPSTLYGPAMVVGTPLEKMQYYVTSLSARFSF